MQHRPPTQRRAGLPRIVGNSRIYAGWWVIGAISLVSFSRVAFFNPVLGVFVSPLEDEFGWSRTTIALALTMGTLLGAFSTIIVGRLMDRYGSRYFLTGTMALAGTLLLLLATMDQVWQFYVYFGLGRALIVGIVDVAVIVTVANWFIRYRGRAMGIMLVGVRGAMGVMPLIVLAFISAADFRAGFAALGVLILIFGVVPPYIFVRRRPEDVGLLPDGDHPSPTASAGVHPATPAGATDNDPHWTVRETIRTRAFWLLLLGTSQVFLVGGAINFTMASHLEDSGLTRSTAIVVISVWAFSGIAGGLLGGEMRQRIATRVALPIVLSAAAVMLLWLSIVANAWMAFVFAVVHGIFFGAQQPLNQIAFPDYFGRWSVGAIRGITSPVQFGLNAIGAPIATLVFDARGSFDLIFIIFAVQLLIASALILAAKPPRKRATAARRPP